MTVNPHFDSALKILMQYHSLENLAGKPTLNLEKRPVGLRSNAAWSAYVHALLTAQAIGLREGWVRMHVNRCGQSVFMVLDIPGDGQSNPRRRGGSSCP